MNPLSGKKTITLTVSGVIAVLIGIVQIPTIHTALAGFLSSYPGVAAAIAGIGSIIALFHDPNAGHS